MYHMKYEIKTCRKEIKTLDLNFIQDSINKKNSDITISTLYIA